MKNRITIVSAALLGSLILLASLATTACSETDVVGQVAVTSFDAVVQKLGDQVSYNEMDKSWSLTSPAGDVLLIALDFSRPDADGESPDLELEFSAAPFLAAGLDPAKLPMDSQPKYMLEDGKFMLHANWGDAALKPAPGGADGKGIVASAGDAPANGIVTSLKQILASYRDRVGYHEKLDHYGIALGDGNMVEWAKDMATNDKDLVFVLNPQPLIDAGLDPAKVAGWVFAKVEVKDANGKTEQVDKLLKPFSL